jgi:DNA-binding NtrC family response regulator
MSWIREILGSGERRIEVLAVMPDTQDRGALEGIAAREHWALRFAPGCESASDALKKHPAAVIICDRDQLRRDWREALALLAAEAPGRPIIVSAAETDDKFWMEVMERGGYDVVTRPFVEPRLVNLVRRAAGEYTDSK